MSTVFAQTIARCRTAAVIAVALTTAVFVSAPAPAQTSPAINPGASGPQALQVNPNPKSNIPPSISLSPAVIMAKGNFSQQLTQTLTLSNNTGLDLGFELVAEDVMVKDGKRVFVPAGETPNSIAATAVFTPRTAEVKGMAAPSITKGTILIKAYSSGSADVRLTIPAETNVRAVALVSRGTDKLPTATTGVGMTASLATLVTFNLSDNVKLAPEAVRVTPASETANMTIAQWIANTGTEPALPEGTAAVLSNSGSLVGKAVF